jgi:Cu(I)/Ag(I) efflux system membrane protein CusA/SilA
VLARPKLTIGIALVLLAASLPAYFRLGSEFMPPLAEGTILFMPTTLPGISIGEASRLLEAQDRILAGFPEVARVHGKAGRAETATDPAPLSMFETVVALEPRERWRARKTWYDGWPEWSKPLFRPFSPDRLTFEELVAEMNAALATPGVSNAWTQPIKARLDMLSTGVRTSPSAPPAATSSTSCRVRRRSRATGCGSRSSRRCWGPRSAARTSPRPSKGAPATR